MCIYFRKKEWDKAHAAELQGVGEIFENLLAHAHVSANRSACIIMF